MFKKIFITASIIALNSCLSQAHALSFSKYLKPYLGGGAGVQNFHGYNGLYATFFAGLNMKTGPQDKIYLAGEAFVDTGSLPLSQKRFNRTTYGFGLSFMPGLVLNKTSLLYFRIGIATFRYNKTNSYLPGGQLGLGLQTNIAKHWDLRGEYVYTGRGVVEGFGTNQFNFFNLALVYKFS